jgi:hypothetical protein
MLRQAQYRCNGWGLEGMPEFNKVIYLIKDRQCYISGIESEKRTATINAAEDIVMAIAKKEKFDFLNYRFYDLQTQKGYDYFLPGQFQFDELRLVKDIHGLRVDAWIKSELPKEIFAIFRVHIGTDLKTIYKEVFHKSENLISVMDQDGKFLFVRPDGTPAFREKYLDLIDFQNGAAWVSVGIDTWKKINHQGETISRFHRGRELF